MRKFIHVLLILKRPLTPSGANKGLYLKLLENGIGGRFDDLIKDLYSNTNCAVKISGHRTPFFSYNRGVRQGCVLCPLLFNLFMNELPKLFEKANSDPFLLPNRTRLSSLVYAEILIINYIHFRMRIGHK
jgi:hypothetical protein